MSIPSRRVNVAANRISAGFSEWLEQEVKSSSAEGDINSYLNDFETVRRGLSKGWDHPDNYPARKLESHNNRLPTWLQGYELGLDDDYQAARISFAALMQVSGLYRDQCYMEAEDCEDYMQRRLNVVGINLVQVVNERLKKTLPPTANFTKAQVTFDSLRDQFSRVSRIGETAVKAMSARAAMGYDFMPGSPSARRLVEAQQEWAVLATDAVTFAAKTRSGLAVVPFLEPTSISSQSERVPHYPFGKDFPGWAEVMAA